MDEHDAGAGKNRATITRTFDLPRAQRELEDFVMAEERLQRCLSCLSDLREYLRRRLKHEDLDGATYTALSAVQDHFFDSLNDNDVPEM